MEITKNGEYIGTEERRLYLNGYTVKGECPKCNTKFSQELIPDTYFYDCIESDVESEIGMCCYDCDNEFTIPVKFTVSLEILKKEDSKGKITKTDLHKELFEPTKDMDREPMKSNQAKIGDKVLVCCTSSMGDYPVELEIVDFDIPNDVIHLEGGRDFSISNCKAINPPMNYFIKEIL